MKKPKKIYKLDYNTLKTAFELGGAYETSGRNGESLKCLSLTIFLQLELNTTNDYHNIIIFIYWYTFTGNMSQKNTVSYHLENKLSDKYCISWNIFIEKYGVNKIAKTSKFILKRLELENYNSFISDRF